MLNYKDINELNQRRVLTGEERIPVSKQEYILLDQVKGRPVNLLAKKIRAKKGEPYKLYTVFENLTADDIAAMADPAKYRLVLMRERRHQGDSLRWRIPMLPYEHAKRIQGKKVISQIAGNDTWWPVTGKVVEFWEGKKNFDQVLPLGLNGSHFINVRNRKMRFGVALFKKTGFSGEGWTRLSNIAQVELFKSNDDRILVSVRS